MSKIQFEYDKKYNITAKGSLVSIGKEFPPDELVSQIEGLISTYKKLKALYMKALSNDGIIVGTERADIISHNDNFIHLLIMIAVFLRGKEDLHIISLDQTHHGFMCTITVQFESWNASGRMAPDMIIAYESLNDFFQEKLNPRITAFLNKYKEACKDMLLMPDEKKALGLEIKYILTTAIQMRFLLSHCLINE